MRSNRNLKCTLEEVELIKGYLIKHFHITTSKAFRYNEEVYRMLSIRTFTPKELANCEASSNSTPANPLALS